MSAYTPDSIKRIEESVASNPESMYVQDSGNLYKVINWITNRKNSPQQQHCIIHDYLDRGTSCIEEGRMSPTPVNVNVNVNVVDQYGLLHCFKNGIFVPECNCNNDNWCKSNSPRSSTGHCTTVLGLCTLSTTMIASGWYFLVGNK